MILTLWQKILALAIALIVALGIGFGAGWTVERWHAGSQNADAYQKQMKDLSSGFADAAKTAQAAANTLAAQNHINDQNMVTLLQKLGDQDHAFAQIRSDISRVHVGTCSFDPAAYGMQIRAYQAAFGTPNTASSQGETHRGNAGIGPAKPTR